MNPRPQNQLKLEGFSRSWRPAAVQNNNLPNNKDNRTNGKSGTKNRSKAQLLKLGKINEYRGIELTNQIY